MISILTTFTIVYCISHAAGSRISYTYYPIGGLFNELSEKPSQKAFDNKVRLSGNTNYEGRSLLSKTVDSYSTALELCKATSDGHGIMALIDGRPTNGVCDNVCLLANRYNITHLSVGWEPTESMAQDLFTFLYYPPPDVISKAFTTLIQMLQWDKFTILYEDEGSFTRLQDVINSWPSSQEPIIFRKLDPDGDNRETFKHIFNVEQRGYHILDCELENTYEYFDQIIQVNNNTEFQSFILTNLDAYQLQLHTMRTLYANVSTFRLTTSVEDKWVDINMQSEKLIKLETALTVDAINHIDKVIMSLKEDLKNSQVDEKAITIPALCHQDEISDYEEKAWKLGSLVREKMLGEPTSGYTGNIQFDGFGRRTNFNLFYMKLNASSMFALAGTWNSDLNILPENFNVPDRSSAAAKDSKLMIVSKVGKPYFEVKTAPNGTVYYRGYAVELVEKIFEKIRNETGVDFKYQFYKVEGDGFGNPKPGSKRWDGLLGELIDHRASLAVCDLTITSDRNAVVDFSIPFMTLGIGMLMKERDPEPPKMFSFVEPLSLDVWLYLATTYIIVSFILLICARMSQEDWVNPHPCNQNPENFENIWSFYNCMWFAMGSIMCQGCDILPRAAGSRWISGMWWFFALIVTSSYTANMSTFISDNRRDTDLQDIKDLADQNQISYGLQLNGSTYQFFEKSNDSLYAKLWSTMISAKPSVFTADNDEGLDRVNMSNGKYAFFMESTAIEYYIKRNCKLKKVGANLDSKEYGIAMPKNFPHKGLIDFAILSLQEKGELEVLKKKWWETEDNDNNCAKREKVEDDSGLQMENTSGIFLVLGIGGILGLIVAVIDFLLHSQQISVKERVTFHEALLSEWRASFNPKSLHKPAAPPRSAAPSTVSASPERERSQSRAVSVLRAATSFINFDEIY